MMKSHAGRVVAGYEDWINAPERLASAEVSFGEFWRMDESYWRMAWIEATGELYAEELAAGDRFVLLKCLDKKQVQNLMRTWFDGDKLDAFLARLETVKPVPDPADSLNG